ncbi:ubiquitin fusion degradation protein UFD1 domain-containing protein [Ditylenchus destructor]|nr:ubiquitin fusion degradation protein UFD1 domain-containing protein [Ditylenchus destructor]
MFGLDQFLGLMGRPFNMQLRCYSVPFFAGADAERINTMNYGGNVLLPNSALDQLTRLNVQYPLLFRIQNPDPMHQRVTHAGVLEFMAEEGKCYIPTWMMQQLQLREGAIAIIEYKTLPSATFAKIKPMSTDFLSISNPRAMFEIELRKYRCLTKNDVISIRYNDQVLQFKVMDIKPENAVSITECDVNLEFDTPEGYVEPEPAGSNSDRKPDAPPIPVEAPKSKEWAPFQGEGQRLDERRAKARTISTSSTGGPNIAPVIAEVVPDENYEPGILTFVRYDYRNRSTLEKEKREEQKSGSGGRANAFTGSGQTLRR